MLNQVMLVGRVADEPIKVEKGIVITLAVQRAYKNADGLYETDHIDCTLLNQLADTFCEYCHKGDIVGVRGRLENLNYTASLLLIAEKVTFLSSKPNKEEE